MIMKEYMSVKTLVDKEGVPAGTIGVVVSVYATGPACEVEVWDEHRYPFDVVTYLFSELEEIELQNEKHNKETDPSKPVEKMIGEKYEYQGRTKAVSK